MAGLLSILLILATVIISIQDKIFISLNHNCYEDIYYLRTVGHGCFESHIL